MSNPFSPGYLDAVPGGLSVHGSSGASPFLGPQTGSIRQRCAKFEFFSLSMTKESFGLVLVVTVIYWTGQLLTGTGVSVASLFSTAIFFGLLSVFAGGGLRSAFGCLNAVLICKFLLLGLALKIILFQPADGTLKAPETTGCVMALGFAALFVGTQLQSKFASPTRWSINRPISNQMLLAFAIALFTLSYVAYFAVQVVSGNNDAHAQTGGWLGYARALAVLKSFTIVPPMLYFWKAKTRLWMTHPLILALLGWSTLVGIYSTGKESAVEPLAFYLLVGFMRYGIRDTRLWFVAGLALAYYTLIVFPYSQYVRHNGGRDGTLEQRVEITKDVFWRTLSDPTFRSATTERVSETSFFNEASLAPFNRLAMVGEADRLIAATERQHAFTGGETITWGFKLLTPSILLPDKPVFEAGNYLGHIVGDVHQSDSTTQISYGIMANFYNAFALPGVFIGTTVFIFCFYYYIRIFLGNAAWDGTPSITTHWFIWIVVSFQHSIVESTAAGLIASISFPFVLSIVWMAAKGVCLFMNRKSVYA